ncbi:hypothetical protein ACFE04_013634 [Oxalis oulophora]
MVSEKRLDYFGIYGCQVPVPRGTRSVRRRSAFKKRSEENQMCAFDLLATVAGKLLHEKESSPSGSTSKNDHCADVKNTVKANCPEEYKPLKVETCDPRNCSRKFFLSELVSQVQDNSESPPFPQNGVQLGNGSVITTSDFSEKVISQNLGKSLNDMDSSGSKVDVGPVLYRESVNCNVDGKDILNLSKNVDDPVVWDGKHPALVSSDSSVKVNLCGDYFPHNNNFPVNQDDVNFVSRDDDENSSGCTQSVSKRKVFRSATHVGDRRIRKILASRPWKAAPKWNDARLSSNDVKWKTACQRRIYSNKRQRPDMNFPIKKRKFYSCDSRSNSDDEISNGRISDSSEREMRRDAHNNLHPRKHASGPSASVASHDSVKLKIKSLKVPELFIEMPETATIGSLKRTVMEAVTAMLGGGLRVGVFLQGKKLRDDSKTLLQNGITPDDQLESLGFSLEPKSLQTSQPLCHGDSSFALTSDVPQPLSRCLPSPRIVHQSKTDAAPESRALTVGSVTESDHDSAPCPLVMSINKSITTESKALVTVPTPTTAEALAMVQAHRKSKRSEIAQRRIRRPFTVAEVEALVQAVEKLGTGRWRDVKLRAFDNAKHRTYVDLKDKWKTLVHTARISPQQRRGEPVPQELLDRVLTAHAYWSQQQLKHQQQQQPETCLLL